MILISATPQDLLYSFPAEAMLCISLLCLLPIFAVDNFNRDHGYMCLLILSVACAFLSLIAQHGVFGLLISNSFSTNAKFLVSLMFSLVLIIDNYCSRAGKGALLLLGFAYLAMFLLLSSADWFFLFLSVELLALSSYCLIGLARTRRSLEAALKYFAAGAMSTCLMLFGVLVLFLSCETTSFFAFPQASSAALPFTIFLITALLLKSGSAPFHYWVADAYEGAPSPVTVFLAVTVKLCIFLVLCRVITGPLILGLAFWRPVLIISASLSIIIGCLGALFQKRIKRLLAYSSINNVGYAIAGLSTGSLSGIQASSTYIIFYCGALLLLFSLILGPYGSRPITYVAELRRLRPSRQSSIVSALALFSMAGIPPLSGFWIKFFVLYELIASKLYVLAIIGAFASIISSFYYVSLIKVLYFEEGPVVLGNTNSALPAPILLLLVISLAAYPLFPGTITSLSGSFALGFFTEFL